MSRSFLPWIVISVPALSRRPVSSRLLAAVLVFLAVQSTAVASLGTPQWIAGVYLGVGGGALAFILWVLALQRATPTRVANTMTVNPIAAGLLANWLVGEPITFNLALGLGAVFAGIWIATTEARPQDAAANIAPPR